MGQAGQTESAPQRQQGDNAHRADPLEPLAVSGPASDERGPGGEHAGNREARRC